MLENGGKFKLFPPCISLLFSDEWADHQEHRQDVKKRLLKPEHFFLLECAREKRFWWDHNRGGFDITNFSHHPMGVDSLHLQWKCTSKKGLSSSHSDFKGSPSQGPEHPGMFRSHFAPPTFSSTFLHKLVSHK